MGKGVGVWWTPVSTCFLNNIRIFHGCLVWIEKSYGFGLISVLRPFNTFKVILGVVSYPNHCSWASLLGSLSVLSEHSFASNWQQFTALLESAKGGEIFSWPSLQERMCRTWGSNSGLLAFFNPHQTAMTELDSFSCILFLFSMLLMREN